MEFPVDEIVTYSILFPLPVPITALVESGATPARLEIVEVSPKSVEFPLDDIVMYSIIFENGLNPPTNIPLVELDPPPIEYLFCVRSPKKTEFPLDDIVKK